MSDLQYANLPGGSTWVVYDGTGGPIGVAWLVRGRWYGARSGPLRRPIGPEKTREAVGEKLRSGPQRKCRCGS